MIKRQAEWEFLNLARRLKAVAMIGPLLSGKTTLEF